MKKLIPLCLAFLLFANLNYAEPIAPIPLRKLIIESEVILHGYVLKRTHTKPGRAAEYCRKDVVIIVVREVLQGNLTDDTVYVHYPVQYTCPEPARYIMGNEAIIFLNRSDSFHYVTYGMSYGTKMNLSQEGIQTYKQRIKEMQTILTMEESARKQELVIDWLVKCASSRDTRWEGIYELRHDSNLMLAYAQPVLHEKKSLLTSDHRRLLFNVLISVDAVHISDIALIDLCRGIDDTRLLEFLKKELTKINDDLSWEVDYVMEQIVDLSGDVQLEQLFREFSAIFFTTEKGQKKRKKLRQQFVARMRQVELKKPVFSSEHNVGA
jgi:hypothetical protein